MCFRVPQIRFVCTTFHFFIARSVQTVVVTLLLLCSSYFVGVINTCFALCAHSLLHAHLLCVQFYQLYRSHVKTYCINYTHILDMAFLSNRYILLLHGECTHAWHAWYGDREITDVVGANNLQTWCNGDKLQLTMLQCIQTDYVYKDKHVDKLSTLNTRVN